MDTDKPESSTRVYVADWWTDLEEQFGFEGNSGDEEVLRWEGYRQSPFKTAAFVLGCLASGGALFLISRWSTRARAWFTLTKTSLSSADYVLIKGSDGQYSLEVVERCHYVGYRRSSGTFGQPNVDACRETSALSGSPGDELPYITYKCLRYVYSPRHHCFVQPPPVPPSFNAELSAVLAASQQDVLGDLPLRTHAAVRSMLYGRNVQDIPVPSLGALLVEETFHPFYVFQYASVLLWLGEAYYLFAIVILVATVASVIYSAVTGRTNRLRLARLAHLSSDILLLSNSGAPHLVDASRLLPGDVVWVKPGPLPADMVLLRGECIVDEGMLTGEAVPVRKTGYQGTQHEARPYDPELDKPCTLYGGTSVAQIRARPGDPGLLALVVRTGFHTAKGQLLRLMYPKHQQTRFAKDALAFIGLMLLMGLAGYAWSVHSSATLGIPIGRVIKQAADMVTICVPPSLPVCLSAAIGIAVTRLRRHEIFASVPNKLVAAGHLDVACFDKTGTLTEAGLGLRGIIPVIDSSGRPTFAGMLEEASSFPRDVEQLLASCHSLATVDGGLVGDPLEIKLFQSTGWKLLEGEQGASQESHHNGHHVRVQPALKPSAGLDLLQRFDFTSECARCTVVVRGCTANAATRTFVKGSPEIVRRIVDPASIPADFDAVLNSLTQEGFRVLALAGSHTWAQAWVPGTSRSHAEQGLSFLGFAVMINALRPDSRSTIEALQRVDVRTIMITGDHVRTAVSVGHACAMLEEGPLCIIDAAEGPGHVDALLLTWVAPGERGQPTSVSSAAPTILQGHAACAVTGQGFQQLLQEPNLDILEVALSRAAVWARMAPQQKHHLVELLSERRRYRPASDAVPPSSRCHVAFCGDGANDVGALKAAEVGVSLCDAEASVAAPFTSRRPSVACLLPLMYEGRASVEAAYAIFSFMIAYAFIQLLAANVMYSYGLVLSMWQYIVQDLMVATLLGFLMAYTPSKASLARERPPPRVLSPPVLLPVFAQLALVAASTAVGIESLKRQAWYSRYQPPPWPRELSHWDAGENTVVSLLAFAQLLLTAAVFNRGSLHRRAFWDNPSLSSALAVHGLFLLYLIISPASALTRWIRGTAELPPSFRRQLVYIVILYGASAFAVDVLLACAISRLWHKQQRPSFPVSDTLELSSESHLRM